MRQFKVSYSFFATLIIEAETEEEAESIVEEKPNDELFAFARDGFNITAVEEYEDAP